ncbi:MAG: hypothetical protein LBO66_04900 [Deltaproteobacteria bacterium]|jgi:hypothetical protein|nr:hypothetical protein [Deltaproteobacteria bacterium]
MSKIKQDNARNKNRRGPAIPYDIYCLLFDVCEQYLDNIAWKFPDQSPFNKERYFGLDHFQFAMAMKSQIPNLYFISEGEGEKVAKPPKKIYNGNQKLYQSGVLDLIAFFGSNVKDIDASVYDDYFKKNRITTLTTSNIARTFRGEINEIFKNAGLDYELVF